MHILYSILLILFGAIIGYLIGSIPNAVIIGKIFFHRDPREEGSKNSGGTNAGRVFGLKTGVVVIALDVLKIAIPFLIIYLIYTRIPLFSEIFGDSTTINPYGKGNTLMELAYWIVPMFGIIGHCFSIYIKFQGGKAVSSFIGLAITSSWTAFPIIGLLFWLIVKITKKVSPASLISTLCFVIMSLVIYILYIVLGPEISNYLMYFGFGPDISIYFPCFTTLSFLIIVLRHRPNIKRLIDGNESNAYWIKK